MAYETERDSNGMLRCEDCGRGWWQRQRCPQCGMRLCLPCLIVHDQFQHSRTNPITEHEHEAAQADPD